MLGPRFAEALGQKNLCQEKQRRSETGSSEFECSKNQTVEVGCKKKQVESEMMLGPRYAEAFDQPNRC